MGKASRCFRALLGMKQPQSDPNPNPKQPKENKRRWSFVKSYREKSNATRQPPPPTPHPSSHVRNNTYEQDATTSSLSYGRGGGGDDANKHAIAVAAATAAVAEAAVAAAQAAAAVVRLTHSGRANAGGVNVHSSVHGSRQVEGAAVVIQSHFRGYLARRALRALKGLVKLQALVRGHIMRKKTTETMRCMQAMLRAQARARTVRAYIPESPYASTSKSCPILHPGPPTPEKFEQVVRAKSIKQDQLPKIKRNSSKSSSRLNAMSQDKSIFGSSWSDPPMDDPMWDTQGFVSSMRACLTDDDRGDKILEIDTGKPLRRRSLFETSHSGLLTSDHMSYSLTTSKDSTTHHTDQSPVSCEVIQSLKPLLLQEIDDNNSYCTAENSPQYCSAGSQGDSSRRGPFTPTKSDGCRSLLSGYSDCPSYMAYTESSKAKMRSLSAPKQRPQYERTSSTKRYSVHGIGEHNPRSNPHRVSSMHASFTSKAYPGSGRLDRLGMPVRDSTVVYYSGYLN